LPATPSATIAPAGGSPVTSGGSPATANSPSGSVQIEEFSIRFSGVEAQGTVNGSSGGQGTQNGSGGSNFQMSAFNLQIEEVKVSLTGENGPVAQVQTPQQSANANQPGTAA
jgi:hypothetical protein